MKLNVFIKNLLLWNISIIGFALFFACNQSTEGIEEEVIEEEIEDVEDTYTCDTDTCTEIIRFGLCADVHRNHMYQGEERMQEFVDYMNNEEVDFVMQLGDFCWPLEENKPFVEIWNSFNGPKYSVLGNHDCEKSTKQDFMEFVDYPADETYYSFDYKGYHFVILDNNFGKKDGVIMPYVGNYGTISSTTFDSLVYINEVQYEWLEADLESTNKRTLIFSHHPIHRQLKNLSRFNEIITKQNATYQKVIVAFSGHNHQDWLEQDNGIYHWQINSMAYKYCGSDCYNNTRYSDEIYEEYPAMRRMFPYTDPLYTVMELDPVCKTIKALGDNSDFVPPTPTEMGFTGISSDITARTISY